MKKTMNPETYVVHWVSDEKKKGLFLVCLCGMPTGLIWTKANDKNVTCRKCLSIRREA